MVVPVQNVPQSLLLFTLQALLPQQGRYGTAGKPASPMQRTPDARQDPEAGTGAGAGAGAAVVPVQNVPQSPLFVTLHEPLPQQGRNGTAGKPAAPMQRSPEARHVPEAGAGAGAGAALPVQKRPQLPALVTLQLPLQQPPSHGTAGKPAAPMQRAPGA